MKLYPILFLIPILLSCGGKPESSSNLEIQIGALSTTSPTMLYAARADGTERWGRKLTSEKTTIPLSQGKWKFQAINWDTAGGVAAMEGNPTCAVSSVDLGGESAQIELSLSKETCRDESWYNRTGYSEGTNYLYFGGFSANICPAGVSAADFETYTDCEFPGSTITGYKVSLPEHTNSRPVLNSGMESRCIPSSHILSGALKIPYGPDETYPVFSKLQVFHSPIGTCTGEDCCAGNSTPYEFPSGFGQKVKDFKTWTLQYMMTNKLKIEVKAESRIRINHPLAASYKSCQPITLEHVNAENNLTPSPVTKPLNLTCVNCTFSTTPNCSVPVTTTQIDANSDSSSLYIRVEGFRARFLVRDPTQVSATGAGAIRGIANYSTIDHDYLYSEPINLMSTDPVTPPFQVNDLIVYETRSGNRGKMKIKTLMDINLPGDRIYFDFVTYDNTGTIVSQMSNIFVTACNTNACEIDFDAAPTVGAGTTTPIEVWFQNYGALGWFTQASVPFVFLR